MIYRPFGKTGLQMPVLSAGFMRAMHSWKNVSDSEIPAGSQVNFDNLVQRALELGINHFETARGYGTSEKQLGFALRRIPRKNFLAQTKVPPSDDPQIFRTNCLDSLARLGLSRVDLLAIHGVNDYRSLWQVCRKNGCLCAARQLQGEGKIGFVGFSGHGPAEVIRQAVSHGEDGGFDYLNLHWYYIYQVNSEVLEEAACRNMGVFIISPTDKGGMLHKPPAELVSLCLPLTPMQFNDLYCLSRPEVQTISIGASLPSDFDDHVNALALPGQAAEQVGKIDQRLRDTMQDATGCSRPEGMWHRLPSWEYSPGYIDIRTILWLYNLARGWGLLEYGRKRYGKFGREVQWVPGNNAAGVRQVDLGPIAKGADVEVSDLQRQLEEAHLLFRSTGNPIIP